MRPPMIGGGDTEGTRGPKPMRKGLEYDTPNMKKEPKSEDTKKELRYQESNTKKFAMGGMVRGCKSSQTSGKGFRGTY